MFQILCVLENPVGLLIPIYNLYPERSYVRFLQVVCMRHRLIYIKHLSFTVHTTYKNMEALEEKQMPK